MPGRIIPKDEYRALLKERLLLHRGIDPNSGCWLWTGLSMLNGYGILGVAAYKIDRRPKGLRLVHRLSAYLFLDFNLDSELQVCHKCDTKLCFDPEHLFIGTQLDNMRDMWRKGRGPDQRHPKKLTPEKVIEIRKRYAAGGETTRSLAPKFGVGKSTIQAILGGKIWLSA